MSFSVLGDEVIAATILISRPVRLSRRPQRTSLILGPDATTRNRRGLRLVEG